MSLCSYCLRVCYLEFSGLTGPQGLRVRGLIRATVDILLDNSIRGRVTRNAFASDGRTTNKIFLMMDTCKPANS